MNIIPKHIMSDLYIRFKHDLNDFHNIFANIEIMYWFYLDKFFVLGNCPNVDLIDFTSQFFNQFEYIIPKGFVWDREFDAWKAKKSTNPTASAIIIDPTFEMVIMVKGFGSKRWTFPGGKKENESFKDCAIREVDEELGFDISNGINEKLCIVSQIDGVIRYHYIICNVPLETQFKPKTNFEIEKITWFPLIHMPESKLDNCMATINAQAKDFMPAMNVIKILKRWVVLLKTNHITDALTLAMELVEREDVKSNKPRSKSMSDAKDIKTNQNANLLTTKHKMYLYPKKPEDFSMGSLWCGIQFNKEEFVQDFFRQLPFR